MVDSIEPEERDLQHTNVQLKHPTYFFFTSYRFVVGSYPLPDTPP